MSKSFFFGFVTVYDWEWLWGRTAAQIELRSIDQPIVVYKADDKKEKPWKDGKVSGGYANSQYLKWLEGKKLREREGRKIDFDKTFAKKVDMGELLSTGHIKETE